MSEHAARSISPPPVSSRQNLPSPAFSPSPGAGSNQISIKYNTVSTQEAQGSLNDQRIQQLLLFAARNNYNSGVRMDSVDLLTQKPNDTHVREALMYALRYDSNPGVRLKAMEGLGAYVKGDVRVRDAVLEALVNDSNPGAADAGSASARAGARRQQRAGGAAKAGGERSEPIHPLAGAQ